MLISNLKKLDSIPRTLINFARPVFIPISNFGETGDAMTNGDSAMATDFVRGGYGLKGKGIKIGVISNSYNTLNKASDDENLGELPGGANDTVNTK